MGMSFCLFHLILHSFQKSASNIPPWAKLADFPGKEHLLLSVTVHGQTYTDFPNKAEHINFPELTKLTQEFDKLYTCISNPGDSVHCF